MGVERVVFTKKLIDNYPLPKKGRERIWDQKCSYLCLQITAQAKRTFYLYRYDSLLKKPMQKAIGTYPDVSIESARATAIRWLVEMAEGRLTGKKQIPTLEEASTSYIVNRQSKLAQNTISDYYGMLNNHLEDWKNRQLDTISRQDVISRFLALSEKSPSTANRTFRFLRAIYNEQTDLLNDEMNGHINLTNPIIILTKRKYWHTERPAQDWIPPNILPSFFSTLENMKRFDEFYSLVADYLEFLLFTGLRRREASKLKIKDVNLKELLYMVTPKGKVEVIMPLSNQLADLLERRMAISKIGGSEYVFANLENGGEALNDPRRALSYVKQEVGVHITLHGLRRSFATYAESIDLSQYVIKRLLNHSMGRDVTGVHYIQRDISRLRSALGKIGSHILAISQPENKEPVSIVRNII